MVKFVTYFGMVFGAFIFWQSMEKVHVWMALNRDERMERLEKEKEVKRVREEMIRMAKKEDLLE